MRITALFGFFCLILLFSCKKDSVVPDSVPVKSTATHTDTTLTTNTGTNTTTPISPVTGTAGTTTTTPPAAGTTTTPATGTTGTTTTTTPATGTTGATTTTTPVTGTGTTTTTPTATNTGTTTTTTKPATGTASGATTAPTTTKPATTTTPTTATKPVVTTPTTTAPTTTTQPVVNTIPPSPTGDDTKTLQQLLNAGNVTLTAGKTYNITGLWVPHSLNLNGASINMINTNKWATAITLSAAGASISNGNLTGTWSNSTPGDPNGVMGIEAKANNCSVLHVNISSFASFGILVGPYNNTSVTYCSIANTGYIGFYFDAETAITSGGTFSNNIVDRSMVPAAKILQPAVAIRGSTAISNITTSNWTISGNTLKMPVSPSNMSAECIEVRNMLSSTISNNTFSAGSIGCSSVTCSNITVSSNKLSGSTEEAIEFADCNTSVSQNNIITSTRNVGELLDGDNGCNGITITNDVVSGTTKECIHAYLNTKNVTITGCALTAANGAMAINLQATSNVKIANTVFNGNGVATEAVMLDTCPGNLTITGGSISNFKTCVIAIYNVKSGLTTNNITMSGVTVTGVARALASDVENGAILGSNIVVVNH